MTDKTRRALNVFTRLSPAEQVEFFSELKKFNDAPPAGQKVILEDLQKGTRVSLGPIAGGCPYCGRS
jgi:hypothetical protein